MNVFGAIAHTISGYKVLQLLLLRSETKPAVIVFLHLQPCLNGMYMSFLISVIMAIRSPQVLHLTMAEIG